jgi:hypothetical protein
MQSIIKEIVLTNIITNSSSVIFQPYKLIENNGNTMNFLEMIYDGDNFIRPSINNENRYENMMNLIKNQTEELSMFLIKLDPYFIHFIKYKSKKLFNFAITFDENVENYIPKHSNLFYKNKILSSVHDLFYICKTEWTKELLKFSIEKDWRILECIYDYYDFELCQHAINQNVMCIKYADGIRNVISKCQRIIDQQIVFPVDTGYHQMIEFSITQKMKLCKLAIELNKEKKQIEMKNLMKTIGELIGIDTNEYSELYKLSII